MARRVLTEEKKSAIRDAVARREKRENAGQLTALALQSTEWGPFVQFAINDNDFWSKFTEETGKSRLPEPETHIEKLIDAAKGYDKVRAEVVDDFVLWVTNKAFLQTTEHSELCLSE